jgi:hypothetical protein
MRIFVSHAADDLTLASEFVDLLQLGVGVSYADTFYSSAKGSIPNGQFFVQHILNELNSAEVVIALLSRAYFKSHFCLSEAGAALARQASGFSLFLSLVIPPVQYADLDGALFGVQSGSILDRPALGEIKHRIQTQLVLSGPPPFVWDQKREDFLKVAKTAVDLYEATEALTKIPITDYKWQRDDGPNIFVHSKLRVILTNSTGNDIFIEGATWNSGSDGIPAFEPSQKLKFQINPSDPEALALNIPRDANFRTWIGLADHITATECLRHSGARRTGTLTLNVKVSGQSIKHDLLF